MIFLKSKYSFESLVRQILAKKLSDGTEVLESACYMGCTKEDIKYLESCFFYKEGGNTGIVYGNGRIDLEGDLGEIFWASKNDKQPKINERPDWVTEFLFSGNGLLIDPAEKKIYFVLIPCTGQFAYLDDYLKSLLRTT